MPSQCAVVHVTSLLRELILEAIRVGTLRVRNRLHRALADMIVSQLETASPVPTSITLPTDRRARGSRGGSRRSREYNFLAGVMLQLGGQRQNHRVHLPARARLKLRSVAPPPANAARHRTDDR